MGDKLPTFLELAGIKLKHAGTRDKIINVKVTIPTARMMCRSEAERNHAIRKALEDFLTVDWSKPQDATRFMEMFANNARKALEL